MSNGGRGVEGGGTKKENQTAVCDKSNILYIIGIVRRRRILIKWLGLKELFDSK